MGRGYSRQPLTGFILSIIFRLFSIIDGGEAYREVEAKVGSGEFRAVDP